MSMRKKAIALEYGKNRAPVVTAKGEDEAAIAMIAQARAYGIYVTEDPKLLALLSRLQVDQEIPPELFTAVSVILAWVYWLRGMRPGDEKAETPASTVVPEAVMPDGQEATTAELELLEDATAEADSPQASL